MSSKKDKNFTSDVSIQCETVPHQFAVIPIGPYSQIHVWTHVLQQPQFYQRSKEKSKTQCKKEIDSFDDKRKEERYHSAKKKKDQERFSIQNENHIKPLIFLGQNYPQTMRLDLADLVWELPKSLPPVNSENYNQGQHNISRDFMRVNKEYGMATEALVYTSIPNDLNRLNFNKENREGSHWHKCIHNDSLIHICKKSRIHLRYDNPQNISKESLTIYELENNIKNISLCKVQLDLSNQRSIINGRHQNEGRIKTLNEPKITKNNQKQNSSKIYSKTTPNNASTTQKYTNDKQKYDRISNKIFSKADGLDEKILNEYKNLILPEKEFYETSSEHLNDITEEASSGNKTVCPINLMTSHSSIDSMLDKRNLKSEAFKNIPIQPKCGESFSANRIQNTLLTVNESFKASTNSSKDSSPFKLISIISQGALQEYIFQEYEKYSDLLENISIQEDMLGVDKENSILFILKTMETNTILNLSLLFSPRQKIKFAMAIHSSMNNLQIGGSVWRAICLDVMKDIFSVIKNNLND